MPKPNFKNNKRPVAYVKSQLDNLEIIAEAMGYQNLSDTTNWAIRLATAVLKTNGVETAVAFAKQA